MSLPTFNTWFQALPPVVLLTLLVLWVIHIIRSLTGYISISTFALNSNLDSLHDAYRLISGAFLHADGLHISLNTLAFARVGVKLENQFGTVIYAVLQTLCILGASIFYLLLMYTLRAFDTENSGWTYQSTVGFSACLFALFVIEVETATEEREPLRLFGRFPIPMRVLPWFMILAIQLFMPNVSFMGHVAGAIVGFLFARGLGLWILPSRERAATFDGLISGCVMKFVGRYKSVYGRGTVDPFEISAAKSLNMCSIPSGSLLPLASPGNTDNNPPPPPPASTFPTTGGRRLGSS